MDPNNNQPINTNPLGQPSIPQPVINPVQPQPPVPTTPIPSAATPVSATEPIAQGPKNKGKKGILLLIILIILILGMGFYVFFAKNQLNTAQKATTDNASVVIPTEPIAPTAGPATIDEVIIESPDADLKGVEADLQNL